MTIDMQKQIFMSNLLALLDERDLSQAEVANAIGVSPQTFNTWCRGIALPRMGKIQKLADYFGVDKSYLIDKHDDGQQPDYYLDPEVAQKAQEIYEDPGLRILLDAKRDLSKDDLEAVINIVRALKAKEGHNF